MIREKRLKFIQIGFNSDFKSTNHKTLPVYRHRQHTNADEIDILLLDIRTFPVYSRMIHDICIP